MDIWNTIVQTNTFNFLVMVGIIAIIAKKLKLVSKLQEAADKVKSEIENSDKAKEQSIINLEDAEKVYETTAGEVREISSTAEKNILFIEQLMANEEQKAVEAIKQNMQKALNTTEKNAIRDLSEKTVLASFELAKKHIIHLLETNPRYHQKFIEDSIRELDGLKQ